MAKTTEIAMTLTEAAERWHLHAGYLRNAILRFKLKAHKSGHLWLVTSDQMRQAFGEPRVPQPTTDA